MRIDYTKTALDTLKNLPLPVRKAFYKQAGFLVENLQHPSLHAKKFSESEDLWQARGGLPLRICIGDTLPKSHPSF